MATNNAGLLSSAKSPEVISALLSTHDRQYDFVLSGPVPNQMAQTAATWKAAHAASVAPWVTDPVTQKRYMKRGTKAIRAGLAQNPWLTTEFRAKILKDSMKSSRSETTDLFVSISEAAPAAEVKELLEHPDEDIERVLRGLTPPLALVNKVVELNDEVVFDRVLDLWPNNSRVFSALATTTTVVSLETAIERLCKNSEYDDEDPNVGLFKKFGAIDALTGYGLTPGTVTVEAARYLLDLRGELLSLIEAAEANPELQVAAGHAKRTVESIGRFSFPQVCIEWAIAANDPFLAFVVCNEDTLHQAVELFEQNLSAQPIEARFDTDLALRALADLHEYVDEHATDVAALALVSRLADAVVARIPTPGVAPGDISNWKARYRQIVALLTKNEVFARQDRLSDETKTRLIELVLRTESPRHVPSAVWDPIDSSNKAGPKEDLARLLAVLADLPLEEYYQETAGAVATIDVAAYSTERKPGGFMRYLEFQDIEAAAQCVAKNYTELVAAQRQTVIDTLSKLVVSDDPREHFLQAARYATAVEALVTLLGDNLSQQEHTWLKEAGFAIRTYFEKKEAASQATSTYNRAADAAFLRATKLLLEQHSTVLNVADLVSLLALDAESTLNLRDVMLVTWLKGELDHKPTPELLRDLWPLVEASSSSLPSKRQTSQRTTDGYLATALDREFLWADAAAELLGERLLQRMQHNHVVQRYVIETLEAKTNSPQATVLALNFLHENFEGTLAELIELADALAG